MKEEKQVFNEDKKQNRGFGAVLAGGFYALKIIFRHAPAAAGVYTFLCFTGSVCSVVQILFLQQLVDGAAGYIGHTKGGGEVLLWGSLYITALAAASLYGFFRNKLDWHLRRRLTKSLTPAIAEKFSRMEYQYFENAGFQNVISRMTQNPQEKVQAAFGSMINCVMQAVTLAGMMGIFFRASFWIGMGAALIGIPMWVLNIRAVTIRNRTLGEATADQRMGEYQQGLFIDKNAAYEIKVFRAREHILAMWHETMDRIFARSMKILKEVHRVRIFVNVLKITYVCFTTAALTAGFLGGKIGPGVLVSVLQSVERLFSVMEGVAGSVSDLGKDTYEIGCLREFLNFEEDVRQGTETAERGGGIVFDHVFFKYPGTDREILHDLSFSVKSGERVALVGSNGAGKSTVVKLLCGLYRPDRGHIYLGGKDIASLSGEALRQYVGAVFQDFGTYQLTLRENIAFGDLSKIREDEKLLEALAQADSGELTGLKLDTPLGKLDQDGADLSKGQWQRIAIARAFLSRAEFVVLDEPTASLDPIAESRVYRSFEEVLQKRGSIIVSHRLASARMAERILVLEGGEAAEEGSHEELMKNGGLYAAMYEEQSSWYVGEVQNEEGK